MKKKNIIEDKDLSSENLSIALILILLDKKEPVVDQ